jgi:hypothetical protein
MAISRFSLSTTAEKSCTCAFNPLHVSFMGASIIIVMLIQIHFTEKKSLKQRTIIDIEYNLFLLMRRMKIDFSKCDEFRTAGGSYIIELLLKKPV